MARDSFLSRLSGANLSRWRPSRWWGWLDQGTAAYGHGRGFPLTDPTAPPFFADVRRPLGYLFSVGAVVGAGVLTKLLFQQAEVASVAMLDLLLILFSAVFLGKGPAVAGAAAGYLSIAWLFASPLGSLSVADPQEWLLLLAFLVTGLVTGQLAGALRQQAQSAILREREANILAEVMRELVEHDLQEALAAIISRAQVSLNLAALRVSLGEQCAPLGGGVVASGVAEALVHAEQPDPRGISDEPSNATNAELSEVDAVRTALLSWWPHPEAKQADYPWRHRQYPVTVEGRVVGALVAVRLGTERFSLADHRILGAIAAQLGFACERERLRQEGTETEILRRSDDLKTALLHAVSHDLRTPLASIIAASASLLEEDVAYTPQERLELAQSVNAGAQRLRQLVDNLLDLSRLEAGMLEPQADWYDLRLLVDDVVGRMRSITAGHEVTVAVPDDLPPVFLDYVRIGQVLTNLVENAVKYTPAGSHITVAVTREGEEVRLAVTDNGPGVSEQATARIFEPFFRVDRNNGPPKGAGLGLAVARGLVEAHNGRIWVERPADGGARFVVALPLSSVAAIDDDDDIERGG